MNRTPHSTKISVEEDLARDMLWWQRQAIIESNVVEALAQRFGVTKDALATLRDDIESRMGGLNRDLGTQYFTSLHRVRWNHGDLPVGKQKNT